MRRILVGEGISAKCEESLEKMGYSVIKLPKFDRLQEGVASHADMLIFSYGGTIITHAEYYKKNRTVFDLAGISVKTTDEPVSKEYPEDILFNAVLTKDRILFSKENSTSVLIKALAEKRINVRQGYTACSTCRVDDNSFITTDAGLYRAYTDNGINALLVDKSDIFLPKYDCGFIGGCSVVLEDSVCFFGNIEEHRDYELIKKFIQECGKRIVSLSDEKLTDIGGAVVV
ncbi:MAG: hypothetical protein IJD37_07435 [Clostridia bacterium]|nr:hypothetical protein [Clostridia bacterium]